MGLRFYSLFTLANMTSRSVLLSLLICFLLAYVSKAQSDCSLHGGFVCTGGRILTIDFGEDDDDDTFRYSATFTSGSEECNILQEGVYEVDGATITTTFDDDADNCERLEDNSICQCLDSFDMTPSNSCTVIAGPNGETCTPAPGETTRPLGPNKNMIFIFFGN